MDFGIQLATSSHHWKVVKRAEELGFTHAWFYDRQLLNADPFVAMAASAMHTSHIQLCGLDVRRKPPRRKEDFCPHRRSQRQTRNPKSQILGCPIRHFGFRI